MTNDNVLYHPNIPDPSLRMSNQTVDTDIPMFTLVEIKNMANVPVEYRGLRLRVIGYDTSCMGMRGYKLGVRGEEMSLCIWGREYLEVVQNV